MRNCCLRIALLLVFVGSVRAQSVPDVSGDWQGTLHLPDGDTRVVLRLTKSERGAWSAALYELDKTGPVTSIPVVTMQGDTVKFTAVYLNNSRYAGKVSADGKSLMGTWSMAAAPQPIPLTMIRPTKETAWELPSDTGEVMSPADADPSFAAVTIKPHDPNRPGVGYHWQGGRNFGTTTTVAWMIDYIYGLHKSQLVNAPAWVMEDWFDFQGVPDTPGLFTQEQKNGMMRKMLEERFKLKTHHEQRTMAAFVLTVAKSGPKMVRAVAADPGASMFGRPGPNGGIMLPVRCAAMWDMVTFLQGENEIGRPVVDQTKIQGRYDFDLEWTPEGMEVLPGGPPGIYTALEEQAGLKLTRGTVPVDVIVIDHVERPSEN